jgi:hypothetical protein
MGKRAAKMSDPHGASSSPSSRRSREASWWKYWRSVPRPVQREVESAAREGRGLEEPTVAQVAVHYAAHHQDVLRRERWLGLLFAMMGAFWALEVAEARGTADLVLNLSLAVSALGAAIGWPVVCHRRARRLETTVRANKSAASVS